MTKHKTLLAIIPRKESIEGDYQSLNFNENNGKSSIQILKG